MGLIYFISFFTIIAAFILIWALYQLHNMSDNQVETK
jgi:hypothetical protein